MSTPDIAVSPDIASTMGKLPWFNIGGGAIGAWMASAIGGNNLFIRSIAMIIGAFTGWWMGGNLDHAKNDASPKTYTPDSATLLADAAPGQKQSVAFAHVASVKGAYPTTHIDGHADIKTPAAITVPKLDTMRVHLT